MARVEEAYLSPYIPLNSGVCGYLDSLGARLRRLLGRLDFFRAAHREELPHRHHEGGERQPGGDQRHPHPGSSRRLGRPHPRPSQGTRSLRWCARWWFGSESPITATVGFASAIGHVAPIWHRFRGGRGVATGAGALLAVAPLAGAVAVLAFVGVRQTLRLTSVASLVAAATGALVAAGSLGLSSWVTRMGVALFAVVLIRHIPNLRRLRRGEEPPT